MLIDVRQPAEYDVSHLPGALNAATATDIEEIGISKERAIVVYCSIGYRSGRVARALQAAGYAVMNLEGSIFAWANEGRSLVAKGPTGEKAVQVVHPYNTTWGKLLDREHQGAGSAYSTVE